MSPARAEREVIRLERLTTRAPEKVLAERELRHIKLANAFRDAVR